MNIAISEQKAQLALAYREHATSMENAVAIMDKALALIYSHIVEQGGEATGAPFCRYTNCAEDFSEFDIELGFPIAEAVAGSDALYLTTTYEGKAVEATHQGAYSNLEASYAAMMQCIKENKLELTGDYYDWYLNDPSLTSEDELLTKIVLPLK